MDASQRVVVLLPCALSPTERAGRFADPLDKALRAAGLGRVDGGGTHMDAGGIQSVDVEMLLVDLEGALEFTRQTLLKLGAPPGSTLYFDRDDEDFSISVETGAPVEPPAPEYPPDLVRQTAEKLLASYRSMFVESYAYGPIDPSAYEPDVFTWYDQLTAELGALGFSAVGDVKIVKDPNKPSPGAGPFARRFVSAGGVDRADIFQMKAPNALVATQVVNLVTELDNHTFVWTTTSPNHWNKPDHVLLERFAPGTAPHELHASHTRRLALHLQNNPGVRPVPCGSLQESLDSENRAQALSGAFRRRQAMPTVEELVRLGSEPHLAAAAHADMLLLTAGGTLARWLVTAVTLPRHGAAAPMSLDQLTAYALEQGTRQVQEVGSPLHPFLVLEDGRAFFFVATQGDHGDPMDIALHTLRHRATDAACCALVVDARITLKDGAQSDAIVVMGSQRTAPVGHTWAQGYRPKSVFRSFKVLGPPEQVATSKNLFTEATTAG